MLRRTFSVFLSEGHKKLLPTIRNIGISAHIDSGKTTLSERILFYTGKIKSIHEVKGGDDVGATMDSMELEKERGITIRSAATHCKWKETPINLIDTPGHVDFTIEVERALRVLDGAVLVLCAVAGVQTQTFTVDRQMRRYGVPRVIFINKMDRDGANPAKALKMLRERLGICTAALQIPLGIAHEFEGIIDIITRKVLYFDGKWGETVREVSEIPGYMKEDVEVARRTLTETLANLDPKIEEIFLEEKEPTPEQFDAAIRRQVIANKFVPILMGSAYKNKGVQILMDAVTKYLPSPPERVNVAERFKETVDEDNNRNREKVETVKLESDDDKPLVALAFKLEETQQVGYANYIRVYQGKMRRGDQLLNVRTQKVIPVAKLVRMHANSYQAVEEIRCGEICALLGDAGLSSGDTLVRAIPSGAPGFAGDLLLENMFIPPPVMSLTVKAKKQIEQKPIEAKLKHFCREDPTLHMGTNPETGELIVQGMGELHLDIYFERLRREFNMDTIVGRPTVNYREIIQRGQDFDFVFKRQSGGAGQYAHVKGSVEVLEVDMTKETGTKNRVVLNCQNSEVKENFQKTFAKVFPLTIWPKGPMALAPLWGMKITLTGGGMHEVDSNDQAFKNCAQALFDDIFLKCEPTLIEPWMVVEITAPGQNFSEVLGEFTKRGGVVSNSEVTTEEAVLTGDAALDKMFGFITSLRMLTRGVGTFSMEFKEYRPMTPHAAQEAINKRCKELNRPPFLLA